MAKMEFLTLLYQRALQKGSQDSTDQANAYCLQQVLRENQKFFGTLYKFENFRKAFGKQPVFSEFVTFLAFWRGVESLFARDPAPSLPEPDNLRQSCFVDDKYVDSMRFFRDEVLRREASMTRSELLDSIRKSQQNSNLTEFWSDALERSKRVFSEEIVPVEEVSNMVYYFFVKRYSVDVYSPCETGSVPVPDAEFDYSEDKSLPAELPELQAADFDLKFDDSDNLWNYEYKYRKLLFDLETALPKFYTCYSEAKSELRMSQEDVRRLSEANDLLVNQHSIEKMDLTTRNSHLEGQVEALSGKNRALNDLLKSKDEEIASLTRELTELTDKYNSSTTCALSKELQVYMARCDGLQKTNDNLKAAVGELEGLVYSLKSQEDETIQGLLTERDSLREKMERTESQQSELLEELKQLTINNQSISEELLDFKAQVAKQPPSDPGINEEKLRLEKELNNLKRENELLEIEVQKTRASNEVQAAELDRLVGQLEALSGENRQLQDAQMETERSLDHHIHDNRLRGELLQERETEIHSLTQRVAEMDQQLKELAEINSRIKAKFADLVQENQTLVAKLELMSMPNPQKASSKLLDIIGKYQEVQSPLSNESETTDYDLSEQSDLSTVENRLKVNPELAETRRLNTLNAIKFGRVKTDPDSVSEGTKNNQNRMIYRRPGNLQRSVSVVDGYTEEGYKGGLSMSNYDELGIQAADGPDIIHNAISYFSKRFNLT